MNVVLGKTHLAVSISMKALKAGLTVYYTSLARLIEDLKRALEQNRLERRWRVYRRPTVLVIDEVGYMQLNRQGPSFSSGLSPNAMSTAASS